MGLDFSQYFKCRVTRLLYPRNYFSSWGASATSTFFRSSIFRIFTADSTLTPHELEIVFMSFRQDANHDG